MEALPDLMDQKLVSTAAPQDIMATIEEALDEAAEKANQELSDYNAFFGG